MHLDPSKTEPIGMARYAHEFLESALIVNMATGQLDAYDLAPSIVSTYLIGHSIELSLKAFLLKTGLELKDTKKLNHDLQLTLSKAEERGILKIVKFHTAEKGAFELLDTLYKSKQLEYIVNGLKYFPEPKFITSFAVKLFNSISINVGYQKQVDGFVINFE